MNELRVKEMVREWLSDDKTWETELDGLGGIDLAEYVAQRVIDFAKET